MKDFSSVILDAMWGHAQQVKKANLNSFIKLRGYVKAILGGNSAKNHVYKFVGRYL